MPVAPTDDAHGLAPQCPCQKTPGAPMRSADLWKTTEPPETLWPQTEAACLPDINHLPRSAGIRSMPIGGLTTRVKRIGARQGDRGSVDHTASAHHPLTEPDARPYRPPSADSKQTADARSEFRARVTQRGA